MSTDRPGPPRFLVLEILDPEIQRSVACLRHALGSDIGSPTHITVRGPYWHSIRADDVRRFERIVQGTTISLRGFGTFTNPNESIVYFRAHNDALRRIWWKPDYPQKEFGFNPHVSIHRTANRQQALAISSFLNGQRIELLCKRFHLVLLTSKQEELFPLIPASGEALGQNEDLHQQSIRPEVIDQATQLVASYRSGKAMSR